jgi:hypothetical protein
LLNTSTNSIDLSTWSRGYRRLDYTFGTLQLSGIIAPGAVFVVGRPISDATNGNPTYNQSITFNPPLLNSGTTADGTALFNVPAAQTTPTTIPIDAIVYGGANLNNLIDETGLANPPDAPDVSGRLRTSPDNPSNAWILQARGRWRRCRHQMYRLWPQTSCCRRSCTM